MRLNARLADARALRSASAKEYCDYLQSPCMMSCFPDDFSQMPTFTWTGGEYIPDCDKSRDKGSHIYGLGSLCTFFNRQSL